jgi:hypothetical protein
MIYCNEEIVFIIEHDLRTGTFKGQKNADVEKFPCNNVPAKF